MEVGTNYEILLYPDFRTKCAIRPNRRRIMNRIRSSPEERHRRLPNPIARTKALQQDARVAGNSNLYELNVQDELR